MRNRKRAAIRFHPSPLPPSAFPLYPYSVSAHLTVISGPAGSGKTERLLARYRACLAENRPGAVALAGADLAGGRGGPPPLLDAATERLFRPGVMTFDQFAESILQHTPGADPPAQPAS